MMSDGLFEIVVPILCLGLWFYLALPNANERDDGASPLRDLWSVFLAAFWESLIEHFVRKAFKRKPSQ